MVSSQLIAQVKYEKPPTRCQPTTPPLVRPDFSTTVLGGRASCSMAIVLQMERGSLQLPPASIASLSLTSIYSFNVLRRTQSRSSLFGCVDDEEYRPRVGEHAFYDPIRWLTLALRALSKLWYRNGLATAAYDPPCSNVTFDPRHIPF